MDNPPNSSSDQSGPSVRFSDQLVESETIDIYEMQTVQGISFKPTMANFAANHFNRTLKRLVDSVEMDLPDEPELMVTKKARIAQNQMLHLKTILTESCDEIGSNKNLRTEDGIITAAHDYIRGLEQATESMEQRIKRLRAITSSSSFENDSNDGSTTVASDSNSIGSSQPASSLSVNSFRISNHPNVSRRIDEDRWSEPHPSLSSDSGLALALINTEGLLIQCNERFAVAAGLPYPPPSGLSILPLVHEEDQSIVKDKLQYLRRKFLSTTPSQTSSTSAPASETTSKSGNTPSTELIQRSTDSNDSISVDSSSDGNSSSTSNVDGSKGEMNTPRINRSDLLDLEVRAHGYVQRASAGNGFKLLISSIFSGEQDDRVRQLSVTILSSEVQPPPPSSSTSSSIEEPSVPSSSLPVAEPSNAEMQ